MRLPRSGSRGRRRNSLSRYGNLFRQSSFPSLLTAGALQLAAPATVLVVLVYSVTFAYPVSVRTNYAALALAFLGLSSTLPTLASMFVSGALADRYDRGLLMRTANLVSIVATAGTALDLAYRPGSSLALPGPPGFYLPTWVLVAYPLWAVVTVTSALFRPAYNTSIPRVVETNDLGRANGVIYAVAAVVSAVATLLVGVLLAVGPVVYALGVPFVLYFATQVALVLLDVDLSVVRRSASKSVLREARDGLAYLARRRGLLEITVASLVVNFLSAVALVELGLYLEGWLGLSNGLWYGALVAVLTAGTATGFILASRVRFEHRAGRVMIVLILGMGVGLLALGLVRSIVLALPIAFLYGLMPGMITTVFLSTIQATVPDEVMGRVFSADELGSYALVPVGQFAGGLLVLALGIQGLYLTAGGTIVLFAGLMLVSFGALRRLAYEPKPAGVTEAKASS